MLREKLYFEDMIFRLESLVCYKNLQQDPVLQNLDKMARIIVSDPEMENLNKAYYDFLYALLEKAEELGLRGNIFRKYVIHLFLTDVNPFSVAIEKGIKTKGKTLYELALKDMNALLFYMDMDLKNITENVGYKENILNYTPCVTGENPYLEEIESKGTAVDLLSALCWYYGRMGCGEFAGYPMYKYDEERGIVGVKNHDKVTFSDLIGYKEQKEMLINNTEAFLNGQDSNNVLLAGARGTGKSSCVKALANQYFDRGLRLIEVSKDQLVHLPKILKVLESRGKYFIIFIDDLSFEEFETQYKYMKSMLEGGVEVRPSNVLFYATSNRRHIVKEKWSDKTDGAGEGDEIHTSDAVNEKLSLADRFGLTLTFPKPNPSEYLEIVVGLAHKKKLKIDDDFLKEQAMRWELNQKGLSGRTAKQFIHYILWELKKS